MPVLSYEQGVESRQYSAALLSELNGEEQARAHAAALIGSVATKSEVDFPKSRIGSLYEAIKLAQGGDVEAMVMVQQNAETDLAERVMKAPFVFDPVPLQLADGKLFQNGQSYASISANSLAHTTHPVMRRRTEAEVVNAYRIEQCLKDGLLDQQAMLIFSPAEDLPQFGFETKSMACSIQLVYKQGQTVWVETALVAAKDEKGEFGTEAITKLYSQLTGAELSQQNPTDILSQPLLVNNQLVANGVVDAVRLYDQSAGGRFFGQFKRGNYLNFRRQCQAKLKSLAPTAAELTKNLIDTADQINSPLDAVQTLNKLSANLAILKAVEDPTINPEVFGAVSAKLVQEARVSYALGDYVAYATQVKAAAKHDQSSSCPSGAVGSASEEISGQSSESSTKLEDCEFTSAFCPKCKQKNVRTLVKDGVFHGSCGCTSDGSRSAIAVAPKKGNKKHG